MSTMSAGINIDQRSIVLLPFPFADLSENKKRPALVLSNSIFNRKSPDVVCCLITSNPDASGIRISRRDMESGSLEFESVIKPYRIFTADKSLIYRVIGRLNKEKSKLVVQEITNLVKV